MKRLVVLIKKELKDYFASPMIYLFAGIFSLIMGLLFFNYLVRAKDLYVETLTSAVLVPIFGNMNFIFLFLTPLIAMKSFAEEKKRNSLELLFLSRLTIMQIIWGKFIAAMGVIVFLLSFTLIFPLILSFSGYSDWGIVLMSYLGIIFSVMCYLAVSIFSSSLTDNPILAAVIGFCILLGIMLLVLSGNASSNYLVGEIFKFISIPFHYESLVMGVLKSYDMIYFCSFIGFFIYLTHQALNSRNW